MTEAIVHRDRATTWFSQLVERVAAAEEIIVAKAGKPEARLLPQATHAAPRKPGGREGKARLAENFDEPCRPTSWRTTS